MTSYIIAGAGASGLYTAYRLLQSGKIKPGDTLQLFEWGPTHVGGRIHTYRFPKTMADGQYVEVGGMRFSTDENFPRSIDSGHILVQNLIVELGLQELVQPFVESPVRMYYLRGRTIYSNNISPALLPYNFDADFLARGYGSQTADAILGDMTTLFAPGSDKWTRKDWCKYFTTGTVPEKAATQSYPAGTPVHNIGYWNLLYDQLGDEGFDYVSDANGYTSNVINWNSADAMQANTDYGSNSAYSRLAGGYGLLFDSLAKNIVEMAAKVQSIPPIVMGHRLLNFEHDGAAFTCHFQDEQDGLTTVKGDYLFLAMPRRSLELVAGGCRPDNVLNQEPVQLYLQSSINQPACKIAMLFDQAWWADPKICHNMPVLIDKVGGPTITDLPLRQIYYFANDAVGETGGGPYVLLASYDDMQFDQFWRELEIIGERKVPMSMDYQPLTGPTAMPGNSPLVSLVMKQLAEVHGAAPGAIPAPVQTVFQDWGLNPYGAGYHAWAAHYNICDIMSKIRAPATAILGTPMNLYITGSCYSFDQAWVEGALCVAESVLQDYLDLPPLAKFPADYKLIC